MRRSILLSYQSVQYEATAKRHLAGTIRLAISPPAPSVFAKLDGHLPAVALYFTDMPSGIGLLISLSQEEKANNFILENVSLFLLNCFVWLSSLGPVNSL